MFVKNHHCHPQQKYEQHLTARTMTQSQVMWKVCPGASSKILLFTGWTNIFFFSQQKKEISSFPTSTKPGVVHKGWKKAKTMIFSKECSKNTISENFIGIAIFNMCFEKFGKSALKWGLSRAWNFNIVRLVATWILFGADAKKLKNGCLQH